MIDLAGYSVGDRRLSFPGFIVDDRLLIGSAGHGRANPGAMVGDVSSGLSAIRDLPLVFPCGDSVICAASADVTITVEVGRNCNFLDLGEAWPNRQEWGPSPMCQASGLTCRTSACCRVRQSSVRSSLAQGGTCLNTSDLALLRQRTYIPVDQAASRSRRLFRP